MNNNEREIRLCDIGAMILKSIKSIIAFTLVCAILGGSYGAYREIRKEKRTTVSIEDVKKAENDFESLQKNLSIAQNALRKRSKVEIPDAERNIENAELLVKRHQQYIDNSIFQKMNPFDHAVSRLTFYVETDVAINPDTPWMSSDPQSSIAIAFTSAYDKDTKILDEIRRMMDTDADVRYIKELISVTAIADCFVEIAVYYNDAEIAEKVVNYLYQELTTRMRENINDFSANIISQFTGVEVDWTMSDRQNGNQDNLMNAQRALYDANEVLINLQAGIPDQEKQIEELQKQVDAKETELDDLRKALVGGTISMGKILKETLIFLLAGVILGFVSGSVLAYINRVFRGKLQNQNDLISRYDFPVLGTLPGHKKRLFEKAICTLEGETGSDLASAAQTAVQSIKTAAGEGSVGLVSTRGQELLKTLHELSDKQFTACGSILDDANAVKAMVACDSVVVVEQKESSHLNLIDAELRRVKALGKPVVGAVVVDADGRQKRKDKAFKQA